MRAEKRQAVGGSVVVLHARTTPASSRNRGIQHRQLVHQLAGALRQRLGLCARGHGRLIGAGTSTRSSFSHRTGMRRLRVVLDRSGALPELPADARRRADR